MNDDSSRGFFVESSQMIIKYLRSELVQTFTYGAEFTALKRAVEHAITIRYHLRSMGITVSNQVM